MSEKYFVSQNLSPVLTKMTKEVDAREKELTHQVHRGWLLRSLDQVKHLTPVLISSIKIYITTKDAGKHRGNIEWQSRLVSVVHVLPFTEEETYTGQSATAADHTQKS